MKKYPLLVGIVALPLILAACTQLTDGTHTGGGGITITDEHRGTADDGVNGNFSDASPSAYWTNNERITAAVTVYGSGSCPNKPVSLKVASATRIVLTMKDYPGACTADLGAYTTVFKVPASVSRTKPVQIALKFSYAQNDTKLTLKPNPTLEATTATKLK